MEKKLGKIEVLRGLYKVQKYNRKKYLEYKGPAKKARKYLDRATEAGKLYNAVCIKVLIPKKKTNG